MAIEVLLRKTVEKLGRVGEVVRVRNGYARNYLFPYAIGVEPSKENLRLVEKDKVVEAAAEVERAKHRAELIAKIAAVTLKLEAKSNPEGHLFGSVGGKQVAEALAAMKFPVEERHVRMEPVKQLGEYTAVVHLAEGAEAQVKVSVIDEDTKESSKGDGAPAQAPPKARAPAKDDGGSGEQPQAAAKGEKKAKKAK